MFKLHYYLPLPSCAARASVSPSPISSSDETSTTVQQWRENHNYVVQTCVISNNNFHLHTKMCKLSILITQQRVYTTRKDSCKSSICSKLMVPQWNLTIILPFLDIHTQAPTAKLILDTRPVHFIFVIM